MMKWDIFRKVKGGKGVPDDETDRLIQKVESFAPKEHLERREIFYYNWKTHEHREDSE